MQGRRPLYHTFRIYLVPPRLYFLSVVGPVTGPLYKEKETFLDSFRLLSLDESRAAGAKPTARDVSLKSRDGDTPLQSAVRRGCEESVQALGAEGDD